jgi:hypothetical protein
MSKDTITLPETRTWREIPQQVRPRAMSREGRRRVAVGAVRATFGTVVVAAVAWGSWETAQVLRQDPSAIPSAARSSRIRSLVLVTDGVLDKGWLVRTLALPPDATLMGLDLIRLRSRVLADPQVGSASLIRNFPDTLTVRISERSPVARVMADSGRGAPGVLLVSRDGTAFSGTGIDPATVASLPWLDGVALARRGGVLAPIEGMDAVADLLASAKLEAENLYRTWVVVSLARLASDGEIEVRTRPGTRIVFSAHEDYLRQIAKLDRVTADSNDPTRPLREVNLALGAQVPVSYGTAAPAFGEGAPVPPGTLSAASPLALQNISTIRIDIHREP